MATVQITPDVTAAQALRKGFIRITLTEWTTTAKPAITIGSTFELGLTMYQVQGADADPDPAAAWGGLAAGLVYLYATAAAGVVTFSVSVTVPTWDNDKQGYYNGGAHALAGFRKKGWAGWSAKTILNGREFDCTITGPAYHDIKATTENDPGQLLANVYPADEQFDFLLLKPVAGWLESIVAAAANLNLSMYQNSSWQVIYTIIGSTAGTRSLYGLQLNPNRYRLEGSNDNLNRRRF